MSLSLTHPNSIVAIRDPYVIVVPVLDRDQFALGNRTAAVGINRSVRPKPSPPFGAIITPSMRWLNPTVA